MPQASSQMADKMYEMFGSSTSDEGPIRFLEDAGYKLTRDWTWKKEGIDDIEKMSDDELACMFFLVQEWDFGGLDSGN